MIAFVGILFAMYAAIGAAMQPPIINPMIIAQCVKPISVTKVNELASAIKNSARLTEPIVYRGFLPLAISVEETIGPQPPPPIESKKPPMAAKGKMRFIFWRMLKDIR